METKRKAVILLLDGVGIGEADDADEFGDKGRSTLQNIGRAIEGFNLPNFRKLGLGNIEPLKGIPPAENPQAAFGKMMEQAAGKDSITGHWEIAGLIKQTPFPTYPNGFPESIIEEFEDKIGRSVLCNKPYSGTVVIEDYGKEHLETGNPIVYTSADSVFQIAAHEEIVDVSKLYEWCKIAREMLVGEHNVARVIARPFVGELGDFTRTERRRDFSIEPPRNTMLDNIKKEGLPVVGVGKIEDLFSGKGLTESFHTANNTEGIKKTLELEKEREQGLIFTNLVDFDMRWGHRNNVSGFVNGLQEVDRYLPQFISLNESDMFVITADHGCDPTTESTDHSRENVPLLVYGKKLNPVDLGTRTSFSDLAATITDFLRVENTGNGKSFYGELTDGS